MLLWFLAGGVLFFVYQNTQGSDPMHRLYNLKDVDPASQGGDFDTSFDVFFETAANDTGVPFALLKAHASIESNFNSDAYLDENPNGLDSRQGWASRGLMQILWWPGSNRFAKYGYPDSALGTDGIVMFQPDVNTQIAARLIKDNLGACGGNIKDAINMYNSGVKYSVNPAPNNYTEKVYANYLKIIGG